MEGELKVQHGEGVRRAHSDSDVRVDVDVDGCHGYRDSRTDGFDVFCGFCADADLDPVVCPVYSDSLADVFDCDFDCDPDTWYVHRDSDADVPYV